MKVQSGSEQYDLSFIHAVENFIVNVTTCTIKKGRKVLSVKTVRRYHTDPHNKTTAEAFALVKALDDTKLDYKEKTAFVLAFKKA